MKKIVLIIVTIISSLNAWEINTHRAIDRKAIESSSNLMSFIEHSGIPKDNSYYNNEQFDGYGMTYLKYITDKENGESNGIAKLGQKFQDKPSWQNMIEAGTILEDAQWPDALTAANGRFLNHFYDPQNGGKGLRILGSLFQSATVWARLGVGNEYSHLRALEYFRQGFTSPSLAERKRYQAKMQKSRRLLAFRVQSSAFRDGV